MKEVAEYLKKSPVQYLATIGQDGNPKVRPFQFMYEEDNKIWYCTANTKEVYKELQKHPYVEISAMGGQLSWIRLSGKVVFSDSLAAREKVFEVSPMVKELYKTAGNPAFEVFYLSEASARIFEIGKPPREFSLSKG